LDIGFAARPTREDRFAAEELASGLRPVPTRPFLFPAVRRPTAQLCSTAPVQAPTFHSLTNNQDRTRARLTRSKSRRTARKFAQSHRLVCSTAFKRCCNWRKDRARRQQFRKLKFTIG